MKKKLTDEEALEQARRDPRQTSLFGEEHTQELVEPKPKFSDEKWYDRRHEVIKGIIEKADDLEFDLLEEEDAEEEEAMMWFTKYEANKILDATDGDGPMLFLGNVYDAIKLGQGSNQHMIQAVLDVSTEELYVRNPDIIYLKVPFPDGHEIRPDQFAECMAYLKFCWGKKLRILVHCAAGISRSTSIVCSFMRYADIVPQFDTLDKVLAYVAMIRPIVQPAPLTFKSCKKWLREYPYDGTYGNAEPKGKLDKTVMSNILKLHNDPTCSVRKSLLENDNKERHLLVCTCKL
jgi:hypothetical protein